MQLEILRVLWYTYNGGIKCKFIQNFILLLLIYFRNSYRCGVFYAGDEPGDVPRFTVFVLPKRFEMDCAKDPEEQKAEAKKECTELVSHLEFGLYVLHLIWLPMIKSVWKKISTFFTN